MAVGAKEIQRVIVAVLSDPQAKKPNGILYDATPRVLTLESTPGGVRMEIPLRMETTLAGLNKDVRDALSTMHNVDEHIKQNVILRGSAGAPQ